jgi:hypothetical protein
MYPVIGRCPICRQELSVTRLHCQSCGTTVEGSFSLGPLQRLSQEQIQFVEAFIRSRGNLKELGAELNMSYPTVNSRLNDILIALGYGDRVKVAEPQENIDAQRVTQRVPGGERKKEILAQVRDGTLSAADAERLLRSRT